MTHKTRPFRGAGLGWTLAFLTFHSAAYGEPKDRKTEPVVDAAATTADSQPAEGSVVADLSEMVVVATRTKQTWLDTSGTVTSVSREELQRTGAQDLGGIVKYDPTVVVPFDMTTGDGAVAYAASGSSSFNIRGTEGNRVGVEVDGIRQPPEYVSTSFDAGAETGAGGMGRDYFDPSMFQLVEVLKGGASALYGSDALGGMVSMKTLEASDLLGNKNWGGIARNQYFSRNEGTAWQYGGALKQNNFDLLLVYAGREGQETANNGHTPPDPMQMHSQAWLAKAGYTFGEHRFLLTFENYERSMDADMRSALHPSIALFSIFKKGIENWQGVERQRVSLNWTYEPVKSSWIDGLDTHLYWQDSSNSSRNLSTNPRRLTGFPEEWGIDSTEGRNRRQRIDFETEIYGFTSIARRQLDLGGVHHQLLAGVDVSQEKSSNQFNRIETDGLILPNPDGGLPIVSTQTTVSDRISFAPSETNRIGLFVQDEMKLGRFTATPGIRWDYHEIDASLTQDYVDRLSALLGTGLKPTSGYDNMSISPRLDLMYETSKTTRLYAGYGMGIRNPTAEELTMIFDHPSGGYQEITVPNPELHEEMSHAFKVGYKGESTPGRFAIEGFFTKYTDFIESNVPVSKLPDGTVLSSTENVGEAIIYGFEASGEWNVGDTFKGLEEWRLGLNTGRAYGENQTKNKPINTVEPWKTVGWIGYEDVNGKYGSRLLGTYTAAVTRTDDTTMNGRMFHPPSWFTLDLVAWWKPVEGLTLNAGLNNIFDEEYYNWGTVRRSGGHLGLDTFGGQAGSVTDRLTAPGRNFYLSATYAF